MSSTLENDGIIIRKQYKGIPPRVEYTLTEAGLTLLPIRDLSFDRAMAKYTPAHPAGFHKTSSRGVIQKGDRAFPEFPGSCC